VPEAFAAAEEHASNGCRLLRGGLEVGGKTGAPRFHLPAPKGVTGGGLYSDLAGRKAGCFVDL